MADDTRQETAGRPIPTHGEHGGPLVRLVAHYEDGTTRTIAPEAVEAPHIPGQHDDGGPAFPSTHWGRDSVGEVAPRENVAGMTLRQWYIGQALSGWVAALGRRCGEEGYTDSSAAGEAARLAVITADAALHFAKEQNDG